MTLIKPNRQKHVKEKQEQVKLQHDGSHINTRVLQIGDIVSVKSRFRGGQWKWMPGKVQKVIGPLTYIVKVGSKLRYVHIDHLLKSVVKVNTDDDFSQDNETRISNESVLPTISLPTRSEISENSALKQNENKEIVPQASSTPEPQTSSTSETSNLDKSPSLLDNTRRYPIRERKPPNRLQYEKF